MCQACRSGVGAGAVMAPVRAPAGDARISEGIGMSIQFIRKQCTFTQPDGTTLDVVGWGDSHYAVFETLDGYTVTRDPATGFYEYAKVSTDGMDLESVGVAPGSVSPKTLQLTRSARILPEAARAKAHSFVTGLPLGGERWCERRRQALEARNPGPGGPVFAPPKRTTVGQYVGLCLLVEFPDVPRTISVAEVDAFCNQVGYRGFDNQGSVYDYFKEVSGGSLSYKTTVVEYYTAKHPRSYYTNEKVRQPIRAWELIKEALTHLQARGFDFGRLTRDSEGYVYALNVFYAGECVNSWAQGLWPHSHHLEHRIELAPGISAFDYQFTDMGEALTLGTYCHENGHMICDFPDLYDYGDESSGVGVFCLMCNGAGPNPRNPAHVGAYLKNAAGWTTTTTLADGMAFTAPAGGNQVFVHARNQYEYFIIENRHASGRDANLPGSGLLIWKVDERGDNEHQEMTAKKHYECSVVQADGRYDLERKRYFLGDSGDLFSAPNATSFGPATRPPSKWWDGSASGLEISEISGPGGVMTFKVTFV